MDLFPAGPALRAFGSRDTCPNVVNLSSLCDGGPEVGTVCIGFLRAVAAELVFLDVPELALVRGIDTLCIVVSCPLILKVDGSCLHARSS